MAERERITEQELYDLFGIGIPYAALTYLNKDLSEVPMDQVRENLKLMADCFRQGVQAGRHAAACDVDAVLAIQRAIPP